MAGFKKEAIEIGLWYANQQKQLNMILLIGDAAPNPLDHVLRERKGNWAQKDWDRTEYPSTHYLNEIELLKQKNIPVHSFYLHLDAKKDFQEISTITGGKSFDCTQMDEVLNSETFTDLLMYNYIQSFL